VTVAPAGGGGGGSTPFTLAGAFGTRGVDDVIPLALTLDITQDITETTGPEVLKSWGIDSLKWDPAVLQYYSFNAGPGWVPSVNTTDALVKGKLVFAAVASSAQTTAQASGVVTLATVRFKVIGANGTSTTTVTSPGLLLSKSNSYSYNSQTSVAEASYTAGP
jgi:hypothetical protein